MTRQRIRKSSRTYELLGGAIVLACIALIPGAAFAQNKDTTGVYFLRANHEYSDGHSTLSTSEDIVVGRARRGDRSMILQDFQGGAVTLESGGRTIAAGTTIPTRFDAVAAYDYSGVRAAGTGREVSVFNTYLRPLIAQFPVPGAVGSWTAHTSLAALGLPDQGQDSAVRIDLRRETLNHLDEDLILIEFDIQAFNYRLPDGDAVTHWGRGVAVTDRDFAVIHVAATQHRATAMAADGTVRPFAVRTSLHAIEPDGQMSLRIDEMPQVAAAVRRLGETRGDMLMPLDEAMPAEPFPGEVAARLDLAGFAIGEGGGNPLPVTTGPTRPDPATAPPPGAQDGIAAFRGQATELLLSRGMSGPDADRLLNALLTPDRTLDDWDRMEELRPFLGPLLRMLPSYEESQAEGYQPDPTLVQLTELYRRTDDALIIEMRLEAARLHRAQKWAADGKSTDDPEFRAAMAELEAKHKALIDYRYDLILQKLRLNAEQPPAVIGNELVPGWITDPSNPFAAEDEAMFLLLQEEMRLQIDEAEDIIRLLTEEREVIEDSMYEVTDDFFLNNAFTYSTMIGTVATDLSRWGEWLATQNMRELERLASLIGYPNLASALADAENIIRQSQDPGYRQWAMQAPSCAGYVGCGPNYLERWWQKQANVALGDILADSRDIFSSGGFSDIGISGLNLAYLLRDHALEDGDIVRIRISQFGKVIYEGQVNLTNAGEIFDLMVGRGIASLEIFAVNEGSASPNTAQITVDNVVRGQATQTYSLQTGQTATLRIEAGAKPAPLTGTSGGGQ